MHEWRLFFTALEYFTRWPKPRWVGHDVAWLGPCARYFPAVGLMVGLCGAAVYAVAALCWPVPVAVVLSMAATLLITGALHEDGFADMCDGLGGSGDRERALAIMADSRIGAFGAIGVGVVLLLKFTCLAALRPGQAMLGIICAHAVSRATPLALMVSLPYAKPQVQSKAKPVAQGVGPTELVVGILICVLAVAALAVWARPIEGGAPVAPARWFLAFALSFAAAFACAAPLRIWLRARLGGYTGDCLGAAQQISEVVFYLCFSAVLGAV